MWYSARAPGWQRREVVLLLTDGRVSPVSPCVMNAGPANTYGRKLEGFEREELISELAAKERCMSLFVKIDALSVEGLHLAAQVDADR